MRKVEQFEWKHEEKHLFPSDGKRLLNTQLKMFEGERQNRGIESGEPAVIERYRKRAAFLLSSRNNNVLRRIFAPKPFVM